MTAIPGVALANGSNYWDYSDYSNGSYVPKSGTFTESTFFGSQGPAYKSTVQFFFDTYNRSSILDYNNGGNNPGSTCDNDNAYVTIDVSAVAHTERLDAYDIESSLPIPKFDLESDFGTSGYNEESEVVALGTIKSFQNYSVTTYWGDNRTGASTDAGHIYVQFAMSKEGFSDYNNCINSGDVQIINYYGWTQGSH